ncbi:DNA translocase FtsK 4TM domain-containing protein [Pelagibacteraceae bacterium]|nr:DNA translocase FtsK 4TM domain-containing protein [Pelagibacteraceae bacterium]
MFKYGGFKLFLIKIFLGFLLIGSGLFVLISLGTHNPEDPGLGKLQSFGDITNFFGYFGAFISSALLFLFGIYSYLIGCFVLFVGINLFFGLIIKNIFLKIFLILFSSIFFNHLLAEISFYYGSVGIIYIAATNILESFLNNYNLFFTETYLFDLIINILSLFFLIIILFYIFSIKFRYLKKFKFLEIIISFFYKKTFGLIAFGFSKLNKRNDKKRVYSKSYKSEPVLRKNNLTKRAKVTQKNQGAEFDSYFYELPNIELFARSSIKNSQTKETEKLNQQLSLKLENTLLEYGVEGNIVSFKSGPIVTLFEFIPKAGIKASKVVGLSDDIARAMSSLSARISSQPGKTSLGIEIPNTKREGVFFGDLINDSVFFDGNNSLRLALGKNISGENVYTDLEKMPHLLIAGTTGSGKSVGINSMIMSLIIKFKPNECKLILIDPKMLELSVYEDIPHLLTPVVTNPNKAVYALKWVVREMENRYKLMSSLNVKNIKTFNEKINKFQKSGKKMFREVQTGIDKDTRKPIIEKREIPLEEMPFIVVVIDEMADLMMVAGKEVESLVQRLAQMARASGIHLITATQRPSVDVITGTIKANFPSRISYKVASKFDSRTIINEMGAEQLLGSGDMLFLENGANLQRLHGGFLSEAEIEKVVDFIKKQSVFDFKNEISLNEDNVDNSLSLNFDNGDIDELYSKAVDIVINQQKVSTSFIQRYLQIGYNRAARIVEKMEDDGIVSEANNAGKRQVLKKAN